MRGIKLLIIMECWLNTNTSKLCRLNNNTSLCRPETIRPAEPGALKILNNLNFYIQV